MTPEDLVRLDRRRLREVLEAGHPIDPTALDGLDYGGIALGNPAWVTRVSWLKFFKVFRRAPDGRLVGWNMAATQDGLDAPWTPRLRAGAPVRYWNYTVRPAAPDEPMPYAARQGLIIDYGLAHNPAWDTIRWVRDPLVAVNPGSTDLLLGVSYVALGGWTLHVPTFFCLCAPRPAPPG